MKYGYSDKKNIQILISLLKANSIRKIVASPGATHLNFLISCQQDPFFEMYSELDERNAAYLACGLAAESGEPVVIICTGATASRDYLPGLTEAYYRKLPILAITGTQDISIAGNLSPQFIDRSQQPVDAVKMSVHIQTVKDDNDYWDVNLKINKAISELFRHGGGPVHINLTSEYARDQFGVNELPSTRVIRRYFQNDALPILPTDLRIAVSIGAHKNWTKELTDVVDSFCAEHNAIVLVDHSSGYYGKYRVLATLAAAQEHYRGEIFKIDLLIHIGEHSGDYYTYGRLFAVKEVWRISEDGEMRDTFRKLTCVFEMPELEFFERYSSGSHQGTNNYYNSSVSQINELYSMVPELPLSNIWLAQNLSAKLPKDSVVHLGVSNTMRSWTFFDFPQKNMVWANTGCRGIDGAIPTAVGMSLANPEVIHYCVTGDLTFFYGMNALGNRHIGNNLRIILVNNGKGAEFRLYQHKAQMTVGDDSDSYIAAAGHFGNQSLVLVKDYAESLGFDYYAVHNKNEYYEIEEKVTSPQLSEKPIFIEVFTNCSDENDALYTIRNLIEKAPEPVVEERKMGTIEAGVRHALKTVIGKKGVNAYRAIKYGKE